MMTALIALNAALFQIDPAGTCCKENDCGDEYLSFARETLVEIENGADASDAIVSNLEYYFTIEDSPRIRELARAVIELKIQMEQSQ